MGSFRFEGLRFTLYSHDHPPPHVHCFYGNYEAVLALLPNGMVVVDQRKGAVRPRNTPRAVTRHMLTVASRHADELRFAWEQLHG